MRALIVVSFVIGCGSNHTPSSPDASPGPSLTMLPSAVTVPLGRDQIFVAQGNAAPVTWSVTESGGGAVDGGGSYIAPTTAGTYHVVATDGILSGTATVTVVDFQLTTAAGFIGGSGDADDLGTDARFYVPTDLAGDGNGHLYVADTWNAIIREIDLATGAVTTIAGSPRQYAGVDGIGAAARFYNPSGLAYDSVNGYLYVSDAADCTVRRIVVSTRMVTTIAGAHGMCGNADGASAKFGAPNGIALYNGLLYVADTVNNSIRQITLATNITATIATNVAMGGPNAVVTNGTFLYVSSDDETVRRFTLAGTGNTVISGIAGVSGDVDGAIGTATWGTPSGMVYDYRNSLLIVSDYGYHRIRTISLASNTSSPLAGSGTCGHADGAAATFCQPLGLTIEGGQLYLADRGNNVIRAVSSTATTTVAGMAGNSGLTNGPVATAQLYSPFGLGIDTNDTVYITEAYFDVRTLTSGPSAAVALLAGGATMFHDGTGMAAGFAEPGQPLVDGTTLWVPDAIAVRQVTLPDGTVTTPYGSGTDSGYVDQSGTAARFATAWSAAMSAGKLYVVDQYNNAIRQIDLASGSVSTVAGMAMVGATDGTGTAARFSGPEGIAADGAGNLFVADSNNGTIRKIVLVTGEVTTIAGTAGSFGSVDGIGATARFQHPAALAWDGAGSLYVADDVDHTVRRILIATGAVSTIVGDPGVGGVKLGSVVRARLNTPEGIAITSTGTILLSMYYEPSIVAFAPSP